MFQELPKCSSQFFRRCYDIFLVSLDRTLGELLNGPFVVGLVRQERFLP